MLGTARVDPARGGRVVRRTPLLYRGGADPSLDRPHHVRAGSALVAWGEHLAVVQDDSCFLAVIDPRALTVEDVAFPDLRGGRQFDDVRGNKKQKLDLEAVFVTPDGARLVALGSGSSSLRECAVVIADRLAPSVTVVELPALYAAFRADAGFAGSELNIEGATLFEDDLVLFQRGNGAPTATQRAVDATARLPLAPFLAYLDGAGPAPQLRDVRAWELGAIDGHRLTFTDGAVHAGALAFLACAEDSPDATRDGPVSAVAIGCLDDRAGAATLGLLLDEAGAPLRDKAEGLTFDPSRPDRAFVVTDRDDPAAPAELLEIALEAAWMHR